MATSSNWSTSNGYIVYYADVNTISQDINNNRSIVNVKIYVKRTNTGYETYGNGTVYLNVDGQTRSSGITSSQSITSTPRLIHDENYTINHNTDGSKTIYVQSYISHDRFSSSWQGFDVSLSTIPRTSPVWVNVSSANAGTQVTVSVNRAVSSFTHSAHMVINGSIYGICVKSTATSWNWTIPIEVINHIPSSTSGTFTIYCDTYNGSTLLGTSSTTLTVNAPNNITPSFDGLELERVDANGVPSSWGVYVKGKSKVKYSVWGASGSYGSWITNYVVSGCGGTWYNWQETTGELWSSGNQTFTATITDSRGRTTTKTNSITIYDYWNPYIDWFSAKRCNSDGSLNEDGQYALVQLNYGYASINNKNTPYAKVWYRRKGTEVWSNEILLNNGSAKVIGSNDISSNNTYELCIRAGDYFTYVDRYVDLPSAKVTMDFRNGGNGIAIGKVAEKDGLEIDWDTTFNKNITMANDKGMNWNVNGDGADITFHADNPSGSSYIKYNVKDDLDECHLFGGTHWQNGWQEWAKINSSGIDIKGNSVWNNGNCIFTTGTDQYCWKYENGMQIIHIRKNLGSKTLSFQWGGIYTQGGAQGDLPAFVSSFSYPPSVHISCDGAGGSCFIVRSSAATTSHPGSYELARGSSGTCPDVTIHVVATGRWK